MVCSMWWRGHIHLWRIMGALGVGGAEGWASLSLPCSQWVKRLRPSSCGPPTWRQHVSPVCAAGPGQLWRRKSSPQLWGLGSPRSQCQHLMRADGLWPPMGEARRAREPAPCTPFHMTPLHSWGGAPQPIHTLSGILIMQGHCVTKSHQEDGGAQVWRYHSPGQLCVQQGCSP